MQSQKIDGTSLYFTYLLPRKRKPIGQSFQKPTLKECLDLVQRFAKVNKAKIISGDYQACIISHDKLSTGEAYTTFQFEIFAPRTKLTAEQIAQLNGGKDEN